jgi:hypothetical protein
MWADFEKVWHDILQAQQSATRPDELALANTLAQLVLVLLQQNKYANAQQLAGECLKLREKLIPDDWRTFNTRSQLGACLLGLKKYADAEPLLLSGYEGMKQREDKIPAAGKARLKEALQRLVQFYEATGPSAEAAEWKKKLSELDQAKPEKNATPP